jgi:NHLM bacteriocin system ABC transporter peptidase/ATP-binding protein
MIWPFARSARRRTPTVFQHEAAECGIACLAMILGYHGRFVPLEELREVAGVNRDGTKASNIVKTAARYELSGKGYSIEPKDLAAEQLPMIVFWNFDHFVVIEGFKGDRVFLNDPATGPRTISMHEFNGAFTGVVLAFTPTAEFKASGEPPSLLRIIRESLAGFGAPLAGTVLAGFLLVIPGLLVPGLQRAFVDYFLIGGLDHWLYWLIGGIAAVALVKATIIFLQQHTLARFQVRYGISTSGRLLWQILHLPVPFFSQRHSGDLASRLTAADRLTGLLSGSLAVALVNLLVISIYGAVMATYDLPLTLLLVGFAALNLTLLLWLSRRLSDAHQHMLQDDARLQAMILQGFANLETYRASGSESLFFRRWAGAHAKVVSAEQTMAFWQRLLGSLPIMLTTIAGVAIVFYGGVSIMEGTLTIGMLVAFQALMLNFNAPVASFVGVGGQLQQTRGYADRLGDILRQRLDPMLSTVEHMDNLTAPLGSLMLDRVTFGYAAVNPPFIHELSLDVPAGSRVAIVGATGGGKSTLGKLIVGLLAPRAGSIRLDGVDIGRLPSPVLRGAVAYVDQTTTLFAGTVRDNLTLWDPTIAEERMIAAAQDATVHEVIAARPTAYETNVEENGRNFSGGERQQLAIARALAVDPVLIVFDEATSALDAVVEQAIFDNIRRRGCTSILISHRLSAVRDCDEIVVLDAGRIVERGRHSALVTAGGLYKRLVEA